MSEGTARQIGEARIASPNYPRFYLVPAIREHPDATCWEGTIAPFQTDAAAKRVLKALDQGLPVTVVEGTLDAEDKRTKEHWAEPLLESMKQECKLLVVVPPGTAHPRSYLTDPLYDRVFFRYHDHPHPRWDQAIELSGSLLPGMCVYSAAEFTYNSTFDRLTQFLDQAALWVGRHLIWLKTRQLLKRTDGMERVIAALPADPVIEAALTGGYLRGLWPGPRAKATTPEEHYSLIKPNQECWCGTGIPYSNCHRTREAPA